MLMARGAEEFESHFPGLLETMVGDGVPILENRPDCIHFGAAGHVLGTAHRLQSEFTAYVPSRPQLEWQIRRRVLAIENVDIVHAAVTEPTYDAVRGRVTGVRLDSDDVVPADLVVDATGRGTRLPVWLEKWGYGRAREETVDVGIAYASQQVRVPDGLLAEKVVVAGASREQPLGVGMLFYEDGNWNVTTFGIGKVEPPQNFAQICDLADQILPAHVSGCAAARDTAGRDGVSQVPDQPVAPLRRARALSGRHHPVRRRGGEFQPDLRPGHDDDGHPGGQSADGVEFRRPRSRRRAGEGDGEDHVAGLDHDGHR